MATETIGEKRRVAIYCRCSTNHQDTEIQRSDLIAYTERRGWTYRVYEDVGVSGAKNSRPALDELMRDARKRCFDIIAVWRFDRFGRSTSHLINSLSEFQSLGIDFVSINESVDTTTPAGRVLFSVIAAIAEFERCLIQERVRAGVKRARESGVRFGRPHAGFDVSRAIEMYLTHASLREIGKALGVSHVTIRRALKAFSATGMSVTKVA